MENEENVDYKELAKVLDIPLFTGFEKVEAEDKHTVFMTSNNHGIMYQVICDGKMNEKETISVRINMFIEKTLRFMKSQGFETDENTFMHYKDYEDYDFGFKCYFQDIIMSQVGKVIRSINAFFIEPRNKNFYQVVMSVGPYKYPTSSLKVGEIDLENDAITKNIMILFEELLANIKYTDEE